MNTTSLLLFAFLLILATIAAAVSNDTAHPSPPALEESEDEAANEFAELDVPSLSKEELTNVTDMELADPGTTGRRLWTWRCYKSLSSSITRTTYKIGGRIRSVRGCLGIAIGYYYRGKWYYARRTAWACTGDSVQVYLRLRVVTLTRVRTYSARGDRYGMNYCCAKR